ncbi:glycoside hydrolase family 3 protein [Sphingobium ummariense]|nr:glycoside hydrolase family 3 N-terminal domain-containing protein [Sphingobium ummariense]
MNWAARQGRFQLSLLAVAGLLGSAAPLPGTARESGQWRDLNRNKKLDRYEDPLLSTKERVDDLIARMTIEEKAGLMVHSSLPAEDSEIGASSKGYDMPRVRSLIEEGKINSFITRLVVTPAEFARQNNMVQKIAEGTRLGIPVTISTDPRHHFQATLGASTTGGGFTLWPDTLGFAALGDANLVRRFGDIARQEYRAVGIHMALSPQADVGSEPRWSRFSATFGSDPAAISRLAGAYVEGFQGGASGVTREGVATVVKHWVGYGAEPNGFDGHNYYGGHVTLSETSFADHVRAFEGPLAARSEGVMPTYVALRGVKIDGKLVEPVGAGFSKQLLSGLLRREKAYQGLIISDWAITRDCPESCVAPSAENPQTPSAIGMPWGVEKLTVPDRFAKGIDAGIDQFGGVDDAAPVLAAVRSGAVSEPRIDESVRRILLLKFRLGLFDNPYVDEEGARKMVGSATWQREADEAQRQSQILLRNEGAILPLNARQKIWLFGADAKPFKAAGYSVVDDPADADVALVRTATPFEKLHPHHFFGSRQHEGRLDFRENDPAMAALKRAAAHVPVILAVEMDRPAVLTNVLPYSKAVLVNFGTSDAILVDILSGRSRICGHLPFALPDSMAAVEQQRSDISDDEKPLFRHGAGLCLRGGGAKAPR